MTGCQESRVSVKGVQFSARDFQFFFQLGKFAGWTLLLTLPSWPNWRKTFRSDVILKHPFLKRHNFCHLKPLDLCQFFFDHTYFRTIQKRQRQLVGASKIQSYWEATTLLGILKRVNNTVPYHSPVRNNDFTSKIWTSSYCYGTTFYRDSRIGSAFIICNKHLPFIGRRVFLGGLFFFGGGKWVDGFSHGFPPLLLVYNHLVHTFFLVFAMGRIPNIPYSFLWFYMIL